MTLGIEEQILRLDIAMDELAVAQELERACELAEEGADDKLGEASGRGVRVVLWLRVRVGGGGEGCVLKAVDAAALLDVVGEVAAGAVLHDEVDVLRCTLEEDKRGV